MMVVWIPSGLCPNTLTYLPSMSSLHKLLGCCTWGGDDAGTAGTACSGEVPAGRSAEVASSGAALPSPPPAADTASPSTAAVAVAAAAAVDSAPAAFVAAIQNHRFASLSPPLTIFVSIHGGHKFVSLHQKPIWFQSTPLIFH
ncbi:hypothetical protein SLEP1_g39210 [Rubroshorea leprosula]|uniref:Uncharacterized protein n=1 Tax=Rubroshorea leprosula TaxID=152421 RepID=A0AAV5KZV7_9ROSI|nr:hypothetical protein SLEP1_g39210 [Rubroshorea leprosula]